MSDHEDELIEAGWRDYASAIAPPQDAAARVRARVDRTLATRGDATAAAEPRAAAAMPRAAAAVLVLKSSALSLGIAFAALGTLHVGAKVLADPPAEPPTIAAAHEEPVEEAAPAAPAVVPVASPSAVPVAADTPAPVAATVTPTPPRRSEPGARAPVAPPDDLAAELASFEDARTAMQRGEHERALALLEAHARSYPKGTFAEERDAYATMCRCALGRGDRAAGIARFDAAHPGSSHRDRVSRACGDSSTDRSPPSE